MAETHDELLVLSWQSNWGIAKVPSKLGLPSKAAAKQLIRDAEGSSLQVAVRAPGQGFPVDVDRFPSFGGFGGDGGATCKRCLFKCVLLAEKSAAWEPYASIC